MDDFIGPIKIKDGVFSGDEYAAEVRRLLLIGRIMNFLSQIK